MGSDCGSEHALAPVPGAQVVPLQQPPLQSAPKLQLVEHTVTPFEPGPHARPTAQSLDC
jgi:hypothetical protein